MPVKVALQRVIIIDLSFGHSVVAIGQRQHLHSAANIDRVQVVQNSVARVIYQAPWSVSTTELRQQLHWLPVRQHIKMSSTTNWQSSPTRPEQPLLQYLSHLIHDYNAGMALSEIC